MQEQIRGLREKVEGFDSAIETKEEEIKVLKAKRTKHKSALKTLERLDEEDATDVESETDAD